MITDAIKTFGDKNSVNIILEKSYEEYINGFKDEDTGQLIKGYKDICEELLNKFPDPTEIELEADKKEFAQLFFNIEYMIVIPRHEDYVGRLVSGKITDISQDFRQILIKHHIY